MNLVADTHALLWHLASSKRLGRNAQRAFRNAEVGKWTIYIPTAVLYEGVLLDERGRIRLAYDELVARLDAHDGFQIVDLSVEDVSEARALRPLVDPFDRMIAGTARRLGFPLITNDERITNSGLTRVYW